MGLAISKSIVESQGGRIWANGEGGNGATFHFTLPVAPAETNPPGMPRDSLHRSGYAGPVGVI